MSEPPCNRRIEMQRVPVHEIGTTGGPEDGPDVLGQHDPPWMEDRILTHLGASRASCHLGATWGAVSSRESGKSPTHCDPDPVPQAESKLNVELRESRDLGELTVQPGRSGSTVTEPVALTRENPALQITRDESGKLRVG
jgi:hypothetical protein